MSLRPRPTTPVAETDLIDGLYDLSAVLDVVRGAMSDLSEEYDLVTEGEGQRRFGSIKRVIDLAAASASGLIGAAELASRTGGAS